MRESIEELAEGNAHNQRYYRASRFELVVTGAMCLITQLGIAIGFHRFFTHRWSETVPVVRLVLGPALMAGFWHRSLKQAALGALWGGRVRIFLVHHATWSVNSVGATQEHSPSAIDVSAPSTTQITHAGSACAIDDFHDFTIARASIGLHEHPFVNYPAPAPPTIAFQADPQLGVVGAVALPTHEAHGSENANYRKLYRAKKRATRNWMFVTRHVARM